MKYSASEEISRTKELIRLRNTVKDQADVIIQNMHDIDGLEIKNSNKSWVIAILSCLLTISWLVIYTLIQ